MRRSEFEVRDAAGVRAILDGCKTCHLGLIDGDKPYVVPLSYGYELTDGVLTLYFHCAKAGRKLDVLQKNGSAGFSVCREGEMRFAGADNPCRSSTGYASVLGAGRVSIVTDEAEKCRALTLLMQRQTGMDIPFTAAQAEGVTVLKLVSVDFSGKQRG